MPLIIAIEPDGRQAAQLVALARGQLRAKLIVADSTERAIAAIDEHVPDLILTSALLSPREEDALADKLRELSAAAAHIQTLTIPVFAAPAHTRNKKGVLSRLRRRRKRANAPDGCDPTVFAEQIAQYLERAESERALIAAVTTEDLPSHSQPAEPVTETVTSIAVTANEPPAVLESPKPEPPAIGRLIDVLFVEPVPAQPPSARVDPLVVMLTPDPMYTTLSAAVEQALTVPYHDVEITLSPWPDDTAIRDGDEGITELAELASAPMDPPIVVPELPTIAVETAEPEPTLEIPTAPLGPVASTIDEPGLAESVELNSPPPSAETTASASASVDLSMPVDAIEVVREAVPFMSEPDEGPTFDELVQLESAILAAALPAAPPDLSAIALTPEPVSAEPTTTSVSTSIDLAMFVDAIEVVKEVEPLAFGPAADQTFDELVQIEPAILAELPAAPPDLSGIALTPEPVSAEPTTTSVSTSVDLAMSVDAIEVVKEVELIVPEAIAEMETAAQPPITPTIDDLAPAELPVFTAELPATPIDVPNVALMPEPVSAAVATPLSPSADTIAVSEPPPTLHEVNAMSTAGELSSPRSAAAAHRRSLLSRLGNWLSDHRPHLHSEGVMHAGFSPHLAETESSERAIEIAGEQQPASIEVAPQVVVPPAVDAIQATESLIQDLTPAASGPSCDEVEHHPHAVEPVVLESIADVEPAASELWMPLPSNLHRVWPELTASLVDAPAFAPSIVEMASEPPVREMAPQPPVRGTSPRRLKTKKKTRKTQRPIEDEWGLFDPEQCGFAALLAKLDEMTESGKKKPGDKQA